MFSMYFGSVISTISSCCILFFLGYFGRILYLGNSFQHWGKSLVVLLILGTFMSAMSGTRDAIGSAGGFPTKGKVFISLCVLGGLGFLTGLIALITKFAHFQKFYKIGTYILAIIIVVKTVLVEVHRISEHFSK